MLSETDLIIVGRAALAAVLGYLIGWERQATGSPIRGRAVALAALTAAALTALGHELYATGADRIVQGVVTGIGFLGAGVIIHGAGGEVRGLTTAASMWAMTGIGVAIGSGHELLGVLLTALVYVTIAAGDWPVLGWLRWLTRRTAAQPAGDPAGATSADGLRSSTATRRASADAQQQPNPAA